MARLRATASAARSVLDGREHGGTLGRVGEPIHSNPTIKKLAHKVIKKRDHAHMFCTCAIMRATIASSSATMVTLMLAMKMNSSSDITSRWLKSPLYEGGRKSHKAVAEDKIVASIPGQRPPTRLAMTMAG